MIKTTRLRPAFLVTLFTAILLLQSYTPVTAQKVEELWRHVEVIRTDKGVPHIRAKNLRAAGYALAWLQLEDYGPQTAMNVLRATGRAGLILGNEAIESDFVYRRFRDRHLANYPKLKPETRQVFEGFAAGINRFIELYPDKFPAGMPNNFTGKDVSALEIVPPNATKVRNLIARLNPTSTPTPTTSDPNEEEGRGPDDGSNAWAFAPSRTKSGKAILLRNPHLNWNAGYYEAHMTVPGVIDFYGDFRIGGPFAVIGGFNKNLGFSTTNNDQDLDQFYVLDADTAQADHYLFDGRSVPLKRHDVTIEYKKDSAVTSESRTFWSTSLGPVVHRTNEKIYIMKYAGDGEFRAGEQFLRMMRAKNLAEYKAAMKMRARPTSNFTYADRAGNIYYLWNASLPKLPHPPTDDTTALPAKKITDVWTELVPFAALPQFLNPPGGYIHNENSSPHYTNVRKPVVLKNAYPNFEPPELSLRSQLALQSIENDQKYSLEDIVKLKHNYRALLPDRVKADLIAAARAATPTAETVSALELLEKWDNTTSPESRGAVLFEAWWQTYSFPQGPNRPTPPQRYPDNKRFARVWSTDDPYKTPSGLADIPRALAALPLAIAETKRRYGSIDVAWGEVYRVRRGNVDFPVGGCSNDLGCFRIMGFQRATDGKMVANSGDCWVLAVEFGATPRAYSVLAYGQSRLPESPYHADQAEMFARGEMKKVAFTAADVNAGAIKRYRPGEKK